MAFFLSRWTWIYKKDHKPRHEHQSIASSSRKNNPQKRKRKRKYKYSMSVWHGEQFLTLKTIDFKQYKWLKKQKNDALFMKNNKINENQRIKASKEAIFRRESEVVYTRWSCMAWRIKETDNGLRWSSCQRRGFWRKTRRRGRRALSGSGSIYFLLKKGSDKKIFNKL